MNSPIQLNMHAHSRFAGRYRLYVQKEKSEAIVKDTGWFDNLITYQGLDQIGNPPIYNLTGFFLNTHCGVGTGTTVPTSSDVALEAPLAMYPPSAASHIEGGAIAYVAASSPTPAYYRCIWTYTFPAGTATGNLSEVGVGGALLGDTTPRLFSRALIVDGGGAPTTITVLSNEALTVTYELRLYLDQTDNAYSFLINTTSYSGTFRRALIETAPFLYYSVQIGPFHAMYLTSYNGTIGTVSQSPTGTSGSSNAYSEMSQNSYIPGTYFRDFSRTISTSNDNLSGGISALMTVSPHGNWQFSVSPAIPKTSSVSLQLNWRQSWSLYP